METGSRNVFKATLIARQILFIGRTNLFDLFLVMPMYLIVEKAER